MKRDFGDAVLLRAVEEGYGVSVRSLEALDGHAHSFNFRAKTADGEVFEVKCFPATHEERLKRLLAHTAPSGNPLAATRLFGGKVVGFGRWRLMKTRFLWAISPFSKKKEKRWWQGTPCRLPARNMTCSIFS